MIKYYSSNQLPFVRVVGFLLHTYTQESGLRSTLFKNGFIKYLEQFYTENKDSRELTPHTLEQFYIKCYTPRGDFSSPFYYGEIENDTLEGQVFKEVRRHFFHNFSTTQFFKDIAKPYPYNSLREEHEQVRTKFSEQCIFVENEDPPSSPMVKSARSTAQNKLEKPGGEEERDNENSPRY